MDIWDLNKLTIFIAFVIPGFISIKCYELFFPSAKDASDKLIDAVSYSSINYALLILPIITIEKSSIKTICPLTYYIFYIFVFFIAPIMWVIVWKYLRTSQFFQKNIPHPTQKPWDYVFAQKKPYWVKVVLKDGTVVAGLYAYKSFVSSSPAQEQIYLEQTWIINDNGGFERAKNDTAGVIILTNEISHIELRNYRSQ
jgi:Family of unknown function (DUF6338)